MFSFKTVDRGRSDVRFSVSSGIANVLSTIALMLLFSGVMTATSYAFTCSGTSAVGSTNYKDVRVSITNGTCQTNVGTYANTPVGVEFSHYFSNAGLTVAGNFPGSGLLRIAAQGIVSDPVLTVTDVGPYIQTFVTVDGTYTHTSTHVIGGVTYTLVVTATWSAGVSSVAVVSASVFGGVFGAALSPSSNLDDQQFLFTQLIMNHQSSNMLSGVGSNLDSLFNGNGVAPFVSQNGFAYQSTGAAKRYAARIRNSGSNKRVGAFDILADRSSIKPSTQPASLMGYQPIGQSLNQTFENDALPLLKNNINESAGKDINAAGVGAIVGDIPYSPWNFWVKGSWSVYAGEASSFDGHLIDVVGGVDYRVNDDLIVGVLGGYGVATFDTFTAGTVGSFDAEGVHAGIYMGKRLAPNLTFDALAAYTISEYDNRSGTTTGSFDARRVTVAAHLKGNVDWGSIVVEPTIGLMYASERQDAYTDSSATAHSARTVMVGRLSVGPKFIFQPLESDFGTSQFWFAAKGEYDFSNQSISANSGLPDINDVASLRLQSGINVATIAGATLSLQGDLSGLGSNAFVAYGGTAKITIPF